MAWRGGRIPYFLFIFLVLVLGGHTAYIRPSSPHTAVLLMFDAEQWLRAIILVDGD